jgi:pimeloyl-ACP methyl ester carboxylesterase
MSRIGANIGHGERWPSFEAAADAIWQLSKGFGPHSREEWLGLTRPHVEQVDGGLWAARYDPAIALPIRAITPEIAKGGEAVLWRAYDAIRCPTLLLRGSESDLLSAATAQAMTQRGPRAALVEFTGVGHAPTLVAKDQIAAVRHFLTAPATSD